MYVSATLLLSVCVNLGLLEKEIPLDFLDSMAPLVECMQWLTMRVPMKPQIPEEFPIPNFVSWNTGMNLLKFPIKYMFI